MNDYDFHFMISTLKYACMKKIKKQFSVYTFIINVSVNIKRSC